MFNDKNPLHSFPTLLSFIGRESEIARILEMLSSGLRLITILGMGGVGKSVLVREILARLPKEGRRIISISFEGSRFKSPDAALRFFFNKINLEAPPDDESLLEVLAHYLQDHPTLIVLDACDQIESLHQWAGKLLAICPSTNILAASRKPLGIEGETSFFLGPLPTHSSDAAVPSPATQLFLDRARLADHALTYTGETRASIDQIMTQLEGLPLAIEMVAPMTGLMTVNDLALLLKSNSQYILNEPFSFKEPLTVILDNTWAFLSPEDMDALISLCVFDGSFSYEAAISVAAAPAKSLFNLLQHSLLLQTPDRRLQIHALVRAYVQNLTANTAQSGHQKRFAAYYLSRLSSYSPETPLPFSPDDMPHIWLSAKLAVETGQEELLFKALERLSALAIDKGFSKQTADMLAGIYQKAMSTGNASPSLRNHLKIYEAFLAMRSGLYSRAVAILEDVHLPSDAKEKEFLQGKMDFIKGQSHRNLCNYDLAETHLSRALDYGNRTAQFEISITSLRQLATMRGRQELVEEKFALLQQALQIAQEKNLPYQAIEILTALSVASSDQLMLLDARSYATHALELARSLKNKRLEALALNVYGGALGKGGQLGAAIDVETQARDYFRSHNEFVYEAICEYQLASHYLLCGSLSLMEQSLARHRHLAKICGLNYFNGWSDITQVIGAFYTNDIPKAKEGLYSVDFWGNKYKDDRLIYTGQALLAECHLLCGEYSQSRDALAKAQGFRAEKQADRRLMLWCDVLELRLAMLDKNTPALALLCDRVLDFLKYHSENLHCRPFMAYLCAYKALIMLCDPRAKEVLSSANAQIQAIAESIADPDLRAAFLNNIPDVLDLTRLHKKSILLGDGLLTDRQLEVLKLIAQGHSNQVIAEKLVISTETTRKHVAGLFRRLKVNSRTSAMYKGRELGILD